MVTVCVTTKNAWKKACHDLIDSKVKVCVNTHAYTHINCSILCKAFRSKCDLWTSGYAAGVTYVMVYEVLMTVGKYLIGNDLCFLPHCM